MYQLKKSELRQIAELDVKLVSLRTVCRMKGKPTAKKWYEVKIIPDVSVSKTQKNVILLSEPNFNSLLTTIKKYLNENKRLYEEQRFVDFVF